MKLSNIVCFIAVAASLALSHAVAKPVKVYILAGQSNMEGHAQTKTFPAVAKDPKTADLYKEMVDTEGKPIVCDNVWISYLFGNSTEDKAGQRTGQLTAGYGSQHHIGTGKIGPEFTFGISMQKLVNEPIIIIKTAWGGKSLHTDFRPPSAGPYPWDLKGDEKKIAEKKELTGKYYRLMIEHVKQVLADPKAVYPDYDAQQGYELAGFVWFQGFNDMVGPYPSVGKGKTKDYSEYSTVLASFIRDVRKDLSAPKMPFITGVLGVGGEQANAGNMNFRKAMAATAEMAEFKANVANVYSAEYWPSELDVVDAKAKKIKSKYNSKYKELKTQKMSREQQQKAKQALDEMVQQDMQKGLTEEDLFLLETGKSNQAYHYWGSAKFFGKLGQAFAEAVYKFSNQ